MPKAAMIRELKALKIELMISIWPTVDKRSENFNHMLEHGHLVRTERGARLQFDFEGECTYVDFTSQAARDYVWSIAKANYFDLGIKTFWLDEAEPEYITYAFDNYRYALGPVLQVGNFYPVTYAQAFFEGQTAQGQDNIVNLLRCAWAGSQKFGALVWSGDIGSSWSTFRNQLCAGLNMGLAGLPWWTTDIGGFHGGDPKDPKFQELLIRWFAWSAFCPVMRLHGDREPRQPQQGTTGGAGCCSGADNEVWSFGEQAYAICEKYMHIREELRAYTRSLMREAHERGAPVMRTLFYVFPDDQAAWEVEDEYMYGDKYLVAPILNPGQRSRKVYLPAGCDWVRFQAAGEKLKGGRHIEADAPLDDMPVYVRV